MEEDWVKKCKTCVHCYKKRDDDELLYCRCRNGKCNYKEKKLNDRNGENKSVRDPL